MQVYLGQSSVTKLQKKIFSTITMPKGKRRNYVNITINLDCKQLTIVRTKNEEMVKVFIKHLVKQNYVLSTFLIYVLQRNLQEQKKTVVIANNKDVSILSKCQHS